MPRASSASKGKAANAVEEANKDLDGIDLSGIDFDNVTDPDGPPLPDETPDPGWEEESPEVPGDGDDELSIDDLGVPEPDGTSLLAEYLPALRDELATLTGMVQDQHAFHKTRADSMLTTLKALSDSFGARIDALEGKVHELVSQTRILIQGSAPPAGKLEDVKHADAAPPAKADKPAAKTPPAAKIPTVEEVAKVVGIPTLPKTLAALRGLKPGQELTLDTFKKWAVEKGKVPADKASKIVELLKLKGPITKDTFPAV